MFVKSALTFAKTVLLTAAVGFSASAIAADFPSKPIKFILPFGPGSGTDTSARYYAQKISDLANVPVIVENRPGGNGLIAINAVLEAPADGYTVFIGSNSTLATNLAIFNTLPYDPVADFDPITLMLRTPGVLSVPTSSEFETVHDLVKHARNNPNKLNFGSGSAGYQLMGELFNQINGIEATNIPFKGAGETVTAIAGETVDYGFAEITSSQTLFQSERIRPLVIADGQPANSLPGIPSADEVGMPDFKIYVWTAAVVKSGTPEDIRQKIEDYFFQVSSLPETEEFFERFDQKPQLGGSEDLRTFTAEDIKLWKRIAEAADIEKL